MKIHADIIRRVRKWLLLGLKTDGKLKEQFKSIYPKLLLFLPCILADFLEEHRRVLDQRLQPVVREITDSRARTRDELEGM